MFVVDGRVVCSPSDLTAALDCEFGGLDSCSLIPRDTPRLIAVFSKLLQPGRSSHSVAAGDSTRTA